MMLNGKYKGERAFIIGSGASLKGFDFNILNNEHTFVINHTMRYYPKAKNVVFLDKRFVRECEKEIDNFQGFVWAASRADYQGDRFHPGNIFHFATNYDGPQDQIEKGMYCGALSPLAAINICLCLGYTEIYLLGIDMKPGYFFTDEFKGPDAGSNYDQDKIRRTLKMFREFLPFKNRIFNCNKDSAIDFFDYIPLEDVI